jgi:hypothetical protein
MVLGACSKRAWREAPGLPNIVPNPLPPVADGRVADDPPVNDVRLSATTAACFFPETLEGVEDVDDLLPGSALRLVRPAGSSAAEPFGLLLSTSTIAAHFPTSSRATLRTA